MQLAKVIIVLSDKPDGQLGVSMEFYPELHADKPGTSAQNTAVCFLEWLKREADENI